MSLSNFIRRYFTNIFISIVSENNSYRVYSKVLKNGKLKEKFEKVFEVTLKEDELTDEIEEYLLSLQEKYNFAYISHYLNSMGQGAIKGEGRADFEKFSVDYDSVYRVKFKNWFAYASYIDINWVKKTYENVGIDLIYSPFVIIYTLLNKSKLKSKQTLYMLNLKDSFALAVFKEDCLLFGAFFKINDEEDMDSSDVEDWENEEELESEDLTVLDDNFDEEEEDFSDIEKLDDFDNFDEDIDSFEDKSENAVSLLENFDENDVGIHDIELYGRDMQVYKYLNVFLKEFYKNPIYESDFLEEIVIYDSFDMSVEIIQSIENELALDIQMHKIDIAEVMNELSIKEVYNGL